MSFYNATRMSHFDLNVLWDLANAILKFNPFDPRLWEPGRPCLTNDACIHFNSNGVNWQPFDRSDVLFRVQLWKTPLIQLIAQMGLPPLGWGSNIFVVVHLVGDPLDTIWSLSHKIFLCHRRVEKWSHHRDRQAIAMVVISHDEWGEDNHVEKFLLQVFPAREPDVRDIANSSLVEDQREKTRSACRKAAQSLSADRSTSFVPVTVSIMIFFGSLRLAFEKQCSPAAMINDGITPYYIAHAAVYFNILPAILLSAIVGVSQDRDSIPHILNQLRSDTNEEQFVEGLDSGKRITSGGIYSWQPKKWEHLTSNDEDECWRRWAIAILSWSSVLSGCLVGIGIAYSAPPTGFGCREIAFISTLMLWMFSFSFDIYAHRSFKPKTCYILVFLKDITCSLAILVYNVYSHLGIFNRCSCWTKFGRGPLCFSLEPRISEELHEKMSHEWRTAIIILAVWQLLFVSVICGLSHKGVVLLLSKLRYDDAYENHDRRVEWSDISSRFRRAWRTWFGMIAQRGFRKRRKSVARLVSDLRE